MTGCSTIDTKDTKDTTSTHDQPAMGRILRHTATNASWFFKFERTSAHRWTKSKVRDSYEAVGSAISPGGSKVLDGIRHQKESDFFQQLGIEIRQKNRGLLMFARTFLPTMLVEVLECGFWARLEQAEAVTKSYQGTVVAIEFIGLDLLTSYLLQRLNGEMHLSKILDKLFTLIMDVILSYRGDIIQFTGSSLMAFFEAAEDAERFRHVCGSVHCSHTSEEVACLRAASCCLELQKRMERLDIDLADDCPPVSLACGLGTGDVTLIGLCCGHKGRSSQADYKFAFAGTCMRHAVEAAGLAVKQSVPTIVLESEAWALVSCIVIEGPVIAEAPEFHCLEGLDVMQHTYPMVRHAAQQSFTPKMMALRDFDAEAIDRRLSMSLKFVQHSVMVDSVAGNHDKVNELRQVSILLFHVQGINDATSDEGTGILGSLVDQFMRVVNSEEGCMLKLVADDRGLLFYFAFGLPPLVHLDDPKRACKACIGMVEVVAQFQELVCGAGVVTDRLFCGVIGSDKRREYSVMGPAMQACVSIIRAVEPGCVLVDTATFRHCSGFLDFYTANPIVGGPRLEPIIVFQLLYPLSGDIKDDRHVALTPAQQDQLSKSRSAPLGCDHWIHPCTPPWLSTPPARGGTPTIQDPLFPTVWTGIWCDRPSPHSPPEVETSLPVIDDGMEASEADWKTAVQVRLPWPARSITCGGVSPVPSFSSWRILELAEKHVSQLHHDGGGVLYLTGPFGSGKTELVEHLVCSAVRTKNMQPVFGAMEMRSCDGRTAVQGVLHGILSLLGPSGELKLEDEFQATLHKEVITAAELSALKHAGISLTTASSILELDDGNTKENATRKGSSSCTKPRRVSHGLVQHSRPGSVQSTQSPNSLPLSHNRRKMSEISGGSSLDQASSPRSGPSAGDPEASLVGLVVRLMRKLLEHSPVVATLRVSQGTSRIYSNIPLFWALVQALETLSLSGGVGLNKLVVFVVCQAPHMQPTSLDPEKVLLVSELKRSEVCSYIYKCLGIEESKEPPSLTKSLASPEDGPSKTEDPPVPRQLVTWLSRLADVPRYIEEGLTQLNRSGIISVVNSRCIIDKPLDSVNISDWAHTHMVARVIAEAEALSPEMQEVLQVATTLEGPFSSLDLAAANRHCNSRNTAGYLAMHKCVMRLMACKELLRMGLLCKATDFHWRKHQSECPGYVYDGIAPSWMIPSAVVHQVIGATLFQGRRMELKRAVLVNRALMGLLQYETMGKMRGSLSGICAKAQKRKKLRNQNATYWHSGGDDEGDALGVPMSCLITPIWDEDDDSDENENKSATDTESDEGKNAFLEITHTIEDDYWKHHTMADLLPMNLFRWMRRLLMFYCLTVVAFGTDLTIMFDGSQGLLDDLLVIAMLLVFLDLVGDCLGGHIQTRRIKGACSLLIFLMIFFEVTWAFGMKSDNFLVTRRRTESLFRVLCYVMKFGACTCRLSTEIQIWIRGQPWRGLSQMCRRSDRNKVCPIIAEDEEDSENGGHASEWHSEQLAGIGHGMMQWVVVTLTVFTVVTLGGAKLTDYSYYPDQDFSMLTWVQLIGNHLVNGTGGLTSSEFLTEIGLFDGFYRNMEYGPFRLCKGIATKELDEFLCQQVIWTNPVDTFLEPSRKGYQLDVRSDTIQASFDFTSSAKLEALLRSLLFLSMMLATLAVSVAIDYIVNDMVIGPMMRIFSKVRFVVVKLQERLPELDLQDAGEDEVSMLERAVERVTRLVAEVRHHDPKSKDLEAWTGQGPEGRSQRRMSAQQGGLPFGDPGTSSSSFADVVARPEDHATALRTMGVELEDLYSWSFSVFSLTRSVQSGVTKWLLLQNSASFNLNPSVIDNFVEVVSARYIDRNPYHNWKHAVDVHHTVCRKCSILGVRKFMRKLDIFALQVAAVGHDVAHPGFNNLFLEETSHVLALRYNDRSPLENMHCAMMFELMQSHPEASIFASFSAKQWKDARQVCIEVILSTDNSKHFKHIKEMEMVYAANCDTLARPVAFPHAEDLELLQGDLNRQLILNTLLHGADISNACKPWNICTQWADAVIAEFFRQGDEEKRLGIPVQGLNDRNTLNKPSSQVAFIKFFVAPFNKAMLKIFPPLWQLTECLEVNLQKWHKLMLSEVEMGDEKREASVKQTAKLLEELKEHAELAQTRSPLIASKKDQLLSEATKRWKTKDSRRSGRRSSTASNDFFKEASTADVPQGGQRRSSCGVRQSPDSDEKSRPSHSSA